MNVFNRIMEFALADKKKLGDDTKVNSDDLFREFVGEYLVSLNNDLSDEDQYRLIDIFAAQCGMDVGEYDAFNFPFEEMLENYDKCVTILERSKRMEEQQKEIKRAYVLVKTIIADFVIETKVVCAGFDKEAIHQRFLECVKDEKEEQVRDEIYYDIHDESEDYYAAYDMGYAAENSVEIKVYESDFIA